MIRKIIQISALDSDFGIYMVALCDDGTVWTRGKFLKWEILENDIPQDECDEDDEDEDEDKDL